MEQRDEFGVPLIRSSIPMTLFGLGLALGVVLRPLAIVTYITAAIRGVDEFGDELPPDWLLMYRVLCGLMLFESTLSIVTAWYYFNRRKTALRLVAAALVTAVVSTIVQAAWLAYLAKGDEEQIAQAVSPAAPACIIGFLWLWYFHRSKQVRATLVYPLEVF